MLGLAKVSTVITQGDRFVIEEARVAREFAWLLLP